MLKSALANKLADELDDSVNSDVINLIEDYIDEIVIEIASRYKWDYLNIQTEKTLADSTNEIELDGFIDIIGIQRKDNEDKIHKVNADFLLRHHEDLESDGAPEVYYIDSFDQTNQSWKLKFNNIADQNYVLIIFGKKELGALASGDHIPFPYPVIPIIKHGVRSLWYDHEQETKLAERYESRYERKLERYFKTFQEITDNDVYSPLNSDLNFTSVARSNYDPNLRLDKRSIPST